MARPLNKPAILILVFFQTVLGYFWYSPALFGQIWSASLGRPIPQVFPFTPMTVILVFSSWFFCQMLAWLLGKVEITDPFRGGLTGSLVWMGFLAPTIVLHESMIGAAFPAIYIDLGFALVCSVVSGIVLAVWRVKA